MAVTFLGETAVKTYGELPLPGSVAPDAVLVKTDLSECRISDFKGQNLVLNIFPSIDTPTCATSVRKFNQMAASMADTQVLCISRDLPFAMKRFCGAEGIDNVITASDFRDGSFGKTYGVEMTDGPLRHLHARAVVVIDKNGKVVHSSLVERIGDEPDYDSAIAAISHG